MTVRRIVVIATWALLAPCAHAGDSSDLGAAARVGDAQEGLAAFYAARFAGRRTASGEPYDPAAMTAAHRTLPFGTWVAITRKDGAGQPVQVRINDRGPYRRGRIIDVSGSAAGKLDLLRKGVAAVRIEIVRLPDRPLAGGRGRPH